MRVPPPERLVHLLLCSCLSAAAKFLLTSDCSVYIYYSVCFACSKEWATVLRQVPKPCQDKVSGPSGPAWMWGVGVGRFHDFCSHKVSPQVAGMRWKTALSNSKGETCGHQVANPVTGTFSVICSSLKWAECKVNP